MAISPMTKDAVMRPSLIAAVDKINELITAVNSLDPASIAAMQQDIADLKAADTNITTRIDGVITRTTALETSDASQQSDIDDIKVTLYTPLNMGGN